MIDRPTIDGSSPPFRPSWALRQSSAETICVLLRWQNAQPTADARCCLAAGSWASGSSSLVRIARPAILRAMPASTPQGRTGTRPRGASTRCSGASLPKSMTQWVRCSFSQCASPRYIQVVGNVMLECTDDEHIFFIFLKHAPHAGGSIKNRLLSVPVSILC